MKKKTQNDEPLIQVEQHEEKNTRLSTISTRRTT